MMHETFLSMEQKISCDCLTSWAENFLKATSDRKIDLNLLNQKTAFDFIFSFSIK